MKHWPKTFRIIGFSLVSFVVAGSARAAAWTPPIGVPTPPFGVNETAPTPPSPWNATNTASGGYQFYYVCPTCSSATDMSNTYGYPTKPRMSIPTTIPAGSVVEVHGQINVSTSFTSAGTAAHPVFIRGADYASRPLITSRQTVAGSYAILENIWWGPQNGSDNDFGVGAREGTDHIAIRNCEVSGNLNRAGGIGFGSWSYSGSQSMSYAVVNNCVIHDVGDVNSSIDQDAHGIVVNGSVDHLWVTNNQISYTSGDAIQIEAQSGRRDKIHHVYFAKNHTHHNKQTGGWVKHATDVIFSQNTIHDHRAGNSTAGGCTGFQYGPEYVWFLYNHLYSCDMGIIIAGNDPPGDGQYAFVIGNVIHNIHSASGTTNPYLSGAVVTYAGTNIYFLNNTLYDVDAGFNFPPGWQRIELHNNIVANRTKPASHDIYTEGNNSGIYIDNNILPATPRVNLSGTVYTSLVAFQGGSTKCATCFATDPLFTDAANGNFTLLTNSSAKDNGVSHFAYATFLSRYGISIAFDYAGSIRPQGTAYDIGAYEIGSTYTQPASPAKMQATTP